MSILDCKITPDTDSLQKKGVITPEQADDIDKRLVSLDAQLKASKINMPANRVENALEAQYIDDVNNTLREVMELSKANNTRGLNEGFLASQRNWLGLQFGGLFQYGLDLAGRLSPEEALTAAARQGRNRANRILVNLAVTDELAGAQKKLVPLKGKYGMTDDAFDRFLRDAYEIGFHPQLQHGHGLGPQGIEILKQRQLGFVEWMDELGMEAADRALLEQQVTRVSEVFDAALEMARKLNINVGDAGELQRYMPRFFSKETDVRIGWKKDGPQIEFQTGSGSNSRSDFSNAFTNSRRTNHFVVEDEVILDAALLTDNPNVYEELGVEGVRDLLTDQGKLADAFFQRGKDGETVISSKTLDALVESGLISKLPMTSNEVFDFMKVNYELPFRELNELMVTDWKTTAEIYRKQLEELAGDSMLTKAIADAARNNGWGVSKDLVRPGTEYADFVNLFSDKAIPPRMAERFGISPKEYGEIYVHPQAAQIYRGMMDLTTDPSSMGALANVFEVANHAFDKLGLKELATTFRTQALASTRFFFGQLYGATLQLWAGGGDLAAYATDIGRAFRATAESLTKGRSFETIFTSKLDDTRALYRVPGGAELLTEKELYEWGRGTGVINEYVIPWSNVVERDAPGTLSDRGLQGWIERQARYQREIFADDSNVILKMQRSIGQSWRGTLDPINQATGNAVGFMAEVFDNTARLNLLRAVTLTTDRSVPGVVWREARRFLTTQDLGRIQSNSRELYRYMQSNFYSFDNVGMADKRLSRFVVPFWGFMSRNTVGQVRMLMRRPSRFANWNRLIAALNQSQVTEDDDIPVAAIPQYVFGERSGVYWKHTNDLGEDEYVMFSARGWDSINEGLNPAAGMMDTLMRRMGIWGPSAQVGYVHPREQLSQMPWEKDDRAAVVQQTFNLLYPQWSLAMSAITGTDVSTGYDLSGRGEYLGVEMSNWMIMALRNSAPVTNQINTANPGGIFGRAMKIDYATGEVINPGELSWAGVQRNERRVVSDYRDWWETAAAAARLNPITIDQAKNSGQTETDMYFSIQEGEKYLRNRARSIMTDTANANNPERLQRELDTLKMHAMQLAYLDMEYRALQRWRERRGYAPPQAVRGNTREELFNFIDQELSQSEQYQSIDRLVIQTLQEANENARN